MGLKSEGAKDHIAKVQGEKTGGTKDRIPCRINISILILVSDMGLHVTFLFCSLLWWVHVVNILISATIYKCLLIWSVLWWLHVYPYSIRNIGIHISNLGQDYRDRFYSVYIHGYLQNIVTMVCKYCVHIIFFGRFWP